MIHPDEIRRKAQNLYRAFLGAWLADEPFFPRTIPCDKSLDANLAVAIESVQRLQAESREVRNCGYSIEWEERNSRTHGKNRFPIRIYFANDSDLLRYIGKQKEFARFCESVTRVRAKYPVLDRWISSNRRSLIESAEDVEGLLEAMDYLCAHPRPGLFARELPLSVDTKFIERKHGILRKWLDLVLPPSAIRADEEHFERRFGLRYAEPPILIRFLDDAIQKSVGSPWSVCWIPLHTLAETDVRAEHVLIVENKVNLNTLPKLPGTIAIGGLGNGVTDLRYIGWLRRCHLWYWGDMDVAGYEILSRLRACFPHVQSLLMDNECLTAWQSKISALKQANKSAVPSNLIPAEHSAFCVVTTENIWIEQERFPQSFVVEYLSRKLGNTFSSDSSMSGNPNI